MVQSIDSMNDEQPGEPLNPRMYAHGFWKQVSGDKLLAVSLGLITSQMAA